MTAPDVEIMALNLADGPRLERFARIAARLSPVADLPPGVRKHFDHWGRSGDGGAGAVLRETLVGAVWYRLFTKDDNPLYFVSARVAEIAAAVEPELHGRGLGAALLSRAIDDARRDGLEGLSLNVRQANPARRLYLRAGFKETGREHQHSDGSRSLLMTLIF